MNAAAGAPLESLAGLDDMGTLLIDGQQCRLLRVTGVVPRHSAERNGTRTRLSYASGEIVHFDLGGQRYALVRCEPLPAASQRDDPGPGEPDMRDLLTNRELQIVQLICMGYLTKQVADRLHISEFTVRSYLKTIYCKLGVRSRAAMVFRYAQAFRNGRSTGG
ncbi:MAG TPA: LuxR C-terminal-related transcriptional regulator [Burkholderiaceae bacterium]|nr:LuxR C-terminal-related transcriptional regulator [Burkholderiaceae bacterium]